MFDWLFTLFDNLISEISALINFVVMIIQDIGLIAELTGIVLASLPSYFSWLPSECLAIIVLLFSIVVIYKVLGREG